MNNIERELVDSIQRVAEAARKAFDDAEEHEDDDDFTVSHENMERLREALDGWTKEKADGLRKARDEALYAQARRHYGWDR